MYYAYATEKRDYARIDKLNSLHDASTFWSDVRKMTRNVHSSHGDHQWQRLAEIRYEELCTGMAR